MSTLTAVSAQEVRDWAAARTINGKLGVAAHGRLPQEVIDAFNKSHKRQYVVTDKQPLPVVTVVGKKTDKRGRLNRTTYKVTMPEIRAWAAENGFPVGARGRLPQEVIEAFANREAVVA